MDNSLPELDSHSPRRYDPIWLAGLGARALAEREGSDLFERLVREGLATSRSQQRDPPSLAAELREPVMAWGAGAIRPEPHFLELLVGRLAEAGVSVERMIESMLPASAVPTEAAVLQARRNASARQALLDEFGALSSSDVAELAGSKAGNKAALANRWKQEGRILSVSLHGATCFPGFQFDEHGRPLPVIAEVLKALRPASSDWQIALWLASRTGWLGDRRPVDLLASEPEAVARAATRAAEELIY
jgi:hypothetical protein